MDPLNNPFRPGAGTSPPALIGRDDLIDQFGVAIRRTLQDRPGKSLMPVGLRGVGKTVLLNRFMEIADAEGVQIVQLEAPEAGNFGLMVAVRLRKVLLQLDRLATRAKRAVLQALGVLKAFSLQLPDGSKVSIDVQAAIGEADSGIFVDDLTDLLVAVGNAAREQDTGILIAVDEVQYLSADELGAVITAIHRTTQLDLPVIFVGAGLPQLPGLAGEAKSYAERLFDFPHIGSLDPTEARQVLTVPASEQEVDFDDGALAAIVDESQGYPYFLQEWGYHVWNLAVDSPVSLNDVEAARSDVTHQLDSNFFLVRFDRLTPKEKEYLHAMARLGPGPHRSGDIATELGVKVESVAPRRSGLISKGMIYSPNHGDTAFTVPLFDDYLLRTMKGEK